MTPEARDEHIERLVSTWAPLTDEQIEKLRLLLSISQDITGMREELRVTR